MTDQTPPTGHAPGNSHLPASSNTAETLVIVHPDATTLARATASRLLLALQEAQARTSPVHVALTGGTIGTATLAAIGTDQLRTLVDWTTVHLWWGDERYLPAGDDDRNETQARRAVLDALPIPPGNVHAVPPADDSADVHDAALRYADELRGAGLDSAGAAEFAITLLGVGPDGHVASLFPGKDALTATGVATVAETDSPKPPPQRVSLSLESLLGSEQIWFVVSGADKSPAVAEVLSGGSSLPAARVAGRGRTLWLLDLDAAPVPAPMPPADPA